MRIQLDLFRSGDGRLEGVVSPPGGGREPFTGVLDLLRVLEGIDLPDRDRGRAADTEDRGVEDD
ncbi:hypothetical protein ACFQ34_17260 [Pseudonocardia benzenivorans]|jgi:hypothetical protein|uniref:Uncharacterized protein n=2 Tax=Pseudonocardia TaxID=1847 RepID=F4D1V4_PSEUX|nr:hypothetical protein [Pseudonocardia dioxanivorans]AEA28014.1 hypothetical protein Psed_5890 [Pseudonocardia dioxanivorans CB1190]GJF06293.1 hypothetical protein PSD17_52410 [Pseudonocardia sp. D17]